MMMKEWMAVLAGMLITANAYAYSCSGGSGFDGNVATGITGSLLTSSGTGIWISGWDSGWGLTQIITDDAYNPPIEVLLSCLDGARRTQSENTKFRLVVTGTFTLLPNAWGAGSCIMKVTANLNCQLVNR